MSPVSQAELAARYRTCPTEDLVAATAEPDSYTPEALAAIEDELARRGCSASQRQELLEAAGKKSEGRSREISGVKGFLAWMVFVIAAGSVTILASVGIAARSGSSLASWSMLLSAGQGAFGLFVCVLLVTKSPRAPGYAAMWWLLIIAIGLANALYFDPDGVATGETISNITGSVLWLTYLYSSKRVEATYRPKEASPILSQEAFFSSKMDNE